MMDPMGRAKVQGLGLRLEQRRKALKLSQAEVAELISSSEEQVAHYERERRSPGAAALLALADALGVSADWLLGRDVSMEGDHMPLENLGRPLTPLPGDIEHRPSTVDEQLALARAQGKTWYTIEGRSYRLRKDGWEPV